MADSKTKNTVQKATNPKYIEMIATAIETLKEKGGSSRVAILRFITDKYKVSDNANVVSSRLKLALKKAVESGTLTQVKGTGATGSFKLAKKAAAKPEKPVKKVTSKATKSPKKTKAKKVVKSPKKPKSTKSPKKAKSPKKVAKPKPTKVAAKKPAKKAVKPKVKKPTVKKPAKK